MEENNINQIDNNMSNQSFKQNNDLNQTNINNSPKKNGPIVIFGVALVIAVILVVTLFIENKNSNLDLSKNIINDKMQTLVVYFSKDGENYGKNLDMENKKVLTKGNTKIMAEKIADFINADLYEIEPVVPYPDNLEELYAATKIEFNKNVYPEIKEKINNLNDYDVIFIGYPIWHATYPQIIKTFVRDNEEVLKNKIIVPFNTHAGSGSAGTYKKLFNLIGTLDNKGLNGLAINGVEVSTSDVKIKNWLKGIGYKLK